MKILHKLKVFILILAINFTSVAIASDVILPVSKPKPDMETKIKAAERKFIYPQKRPIPVKEKNEDNADKEILKTENQFIYPEKKPIIVKKEINKIIRKSEVFSKYDFEIAKSVFESVDKKKW